MQIIKLYKYEREGGGITVSPHKPEGECVEMCRIVADEGKVLKKDDIETPCIDVESTEGWEEVAIPEEISDTEALAIIMGGVDG